MDRENPLYISYLEEVAQCVAKGDEPEVISRKLNLDVPFILKCLSDPKFDDILEKIDSRAFKEFKQARAEEQAKARVKQMAREDAVEHYKLYRDLVLEGTMDDKDRALHLEKLIKMAGVIDKENIEEIIKLTPVQIGVIQKALEETR